MSVCTGKQDGCLIQVNSKGDNILTLYAGSQISFMMQIATTGITTADQANITGSTLNGWTYRFNLVSTSPMAILSQAGSTVKGTMYNYAYVHAAFDGTKATADLVIDMALSGTHESMPDLIYLTTLLPRISYYIYGYNILIDKVVPWYEQLGAAITAIPSEITGSFENMRQAVSDNASSTKTWLDKNITTPVGGAFSSIGNAAMTVYNVFLTILTYIWEGLYDVWYFIIEAWPLWIAIAILFGIIEVKKWKAETE